MLTEPWPCATLGCDEQISPTGRAGRPARFCPTCRAARRGAAPAVSLRRAPAEVESLVCGCGRDYLTVPIEESHRCPRPKAAP
jgi:hypothetical protein